MDDDLDTPGAMAMVFDLVRRANASADGADPSGAARLARTAGFLCAALGLTLAGSPIEVDAQTAERIRRRDEARAARDWPRADALRDELEAEGWLVEDGSDGTRVRRR
jgi:cysteinyl-tRNA synthetase